MTAEVAVFGASGFVGSAVSAALDQRGVQVERYVAPRLPDVVLHDVDEAVRAASPVSDALSTRLVGCRAVINAAGDPDASSRAAGSLLAANAVLPGVLASACRVAGIDRFVQVSSAVVQGRRDRLDESLDYDAFSAYAVSKAAGERTALLFGPPGTVVFRPPSVHAPGRRVTVMTARLARSPWATVAAPGRDPSPQALLANVADAVAFIALADDVPRVVAYPWEGLTTADVMTVLGGRVPRRIPRRLAAAAVTAARLLGRVLPTVQADARRIEMLWFGQRQPEGWLVAAGWAPPVGREGWKALGASLRAVGEAPR